MTSRALAYIRQQPWAITPEGLELVCAVAARENRDVEAIERELGRELQNTRQVTIRGDGVALVPVRGPLVRYGNLFSRVSGGTSLEILSRDFHAALAEPEVRAIILDVDSPGGQVNGTLELATLIREARGPKPIVAFVSHLGASGAYWLASAADRIVATPTAQLGGVGVILTFVDFRKQDEMEGVEEIDFISSVSPKKNPDPKTTEGAGQFQAVVDELGRVFVESVAENRGITPERVIQDYGQGWVRVGAQALEAGLADGLGTLEELIEELSAVGQRPAGGGLIIGSSTKEPAMDPKEKPAAKEQPEPDDVTTEKVVINTAADVEKHWPDQVGELKSAAQAEAISAERARVTGIYGLPGIGSHAALRASAVEEGLSVEATSHKLLIAQRDASERTLDAPSSAISPADDEGVTETANLILMAGKEVSHSTPAGQEA